jgi:hypothetical protein
MKKTPKPTQFGETNEEADDENKLSEFKTEMNYARGTPASFDLCYERPLGTMKVQASILSLYKV